MLRHRTPVTVTRCLALLTAFSIALSAVAGGCTSQATPSPSAIAASVLPSPSGSLATTISSLATPSPPVSAPATASPLPSPSLPPSPSVLVPLVPITGFWSTERSIARAELALELAGTAGTRRTVLVATADAAAVASAFGISGSDSGGVVQARSLAEIKAAIARDPKTLGIVRASDVTPDVRALAVDGLSLFGVNRVKDLGKWPLLVPEPDSTAAFDPAAAWTIAAGGDVMLDKGVYANSVLQGRGVNWAWTGGTARITGRTCCGWGGGKLVNAASTGNDGAFAALFRNADVAIANLEAPASDAFTYHSGGFTFSVDPDLLAGLKYAGIDAVSLANNHLGNAGTAGVLDTIRHLDELGVAHTGAGRSQAEARRPVLFDAGGQKIAFLAYSDIQPESYWAAPGRPGTAAYSIATITADIRAARAAGATFVVVMPHWGIEYSEDLYGFQRPDARAMIAAGADIVLASHSHWVGSMEAIDPEHYVFYSLGDLVFDWTHDERTQEGVVADLTFAGTRLVQIDLHPTVILTGGRPALLDPAADGRVVLGPVERASEALAGR